MEHIIQFGVTIDDAAIEAGIRKNAEKIIIEEMKKDVEECFFKFDTSWGNRRVTGLSSAMEARLNDIIDEHKDQIIELAAEKLADKLSRSKAVKEVASGVAKEVKG